MDAEQRRDRRGTLILCAAGVLACAAALLTGPASMLCGVLGGIARAGGLATLSAPTPGPDGARRSPRPQESAIEPQQAVSLHVETPPPVRWLERVEVEAEAARRGRG
jgi:hypothetical protein